MADNSRRAFLVSLGAAGAVGVTGTLPRLQAADSDPILAHINSELTRTHKDVKRLNYLRSDHVLTLAANIRLLALHGATIGLDDTVARATRGRKGQPPPMPNHARQRRELQQHGIDPDSVTMRHPDQQAWDAFAADSDAGMTMTDRFHKAAANLDTLAQRLAKTEAMNLLQPHGGARIVLAQEDMFCNIAVWNVRAMDTFAAVACSLGPIAIELCFSALLMASLIWGAAWFGGCL